VPSLQAIGGRGSDCKCSRQSRDRGCSADQVRCAIASSLLRASQQPFAQAQRLESASCSSCNCNCFENGAAYSDAEEGDSPSRVRRQQAAAGIAAANRAVAAAHWRQKRSDAAARIASALSGTICLRTNVPPRQTHAETAADNLGRARAFCSVPQVMSARASECASR
jgi:hypothetical protein